MDLSINVNVNFNVAPEVESLVKRVCDVYSGRRTAKLLAGMIRAIEDRENSDDQTSPSESEHPETENAENAENAPTSEAPEEPKKKRTKRSKAAQEPAKEAKEDDAQKPSQEETLDYTAEEAPMNTTEMPEAEEGTSDLPFAAETGENKPSRPNMGLDDFRIALDQLRDRLGVNEGQANFEHKREFTQFARQMMAYYGADKTDQLTPTNLFYYAVQLAGTKFENGAFTSVKPSITPEQVEEYKKAPF